LIRQHIVFFVGIGGTGMNGIARVMARRGYAVSGSDRDRDQGNRPAFYRALEQEGIQLFPQDGSGLDPDIDRVITSTAVEARIPDIIRARELGLPVVHRSEALRELVETDVSIAVAGTSGKSTVTGMCAWCLTQAGEDPLVLNGAPIISFGPGGGDTDIRAGRGRYAVFEADESDGSLTRFTPSIGILTNISTDHMPLEALRDIFRTYIHRIGDTLIYNADCGETQRLAPDARHAVSFAVDGSAHFKGRIHEQAFTGSRFSVENVTVRLGIPGRHNIENALACHALMRHLGYSAPEIRDMLVSFRGIRRRFQTAGTANGVTVIDDFAHNPDKIRATMAIVSGNRGRNIYIYQPHGFGPTRFLFDALAQVFAEGPRDRDTVILTPIFYAGGTVNRDINSEMLAARIVERGGSATVIQRARIPKHIADAARSGDAVIVMGARDPSLPGFCQRILAFLEKKNPQQAR